MNVWKQEFSIIDIVILSVTILVSFFTGVYIIPALIIYYISRKIDSNFFKVACYIGVALLVIDGFGWNYMTAIYKLVYENEPFSVSPSLLLDIIRLALYASTSLAYSIVFVGYLNSGHRNRIINVSLLIVVLGNFVVFLGYIISYIFPELFQFIGIVPRQFYSLNYLTPYSIALVFILLYSHLFNLAPANIIEEEIFEETI